MAKSIEEIAKWFEEKLKKDFEDREIGINRQFGNFIEIEVQIKNAEVKWVTIPMILHDGRWDRKNYTRTLSLIENMIKEFE